MTISESMSNAKKALGANFLPKSKIQNQADQINTNIKSAIGISSNKKSSKSKENGIGKLPHYKLHITSQVLDHDKKTPISITAYLPSNISVDFASDYDEPFNQSIIGDNLFGNVLKAFGNSGIVQEMTYKVWKSSRGMSFQLPLVFVADDEYNGEGAEYSDIMIPILKLNRLCAPSKSSTSVFLNPPGSRLAFRDDAKVSGKDFFDTLNSINSANGIEVNALGDKFGLVGSGIREDVEQGNLVQSAVDSAKGAFKAGQSAFHAVEALTVALNGAIKNQLELVNKTSVSIGNFLHLDSVEFESVSSQFDVILDDKGIPLRATVNVSFTTSMTPTIEDIYRIFRRSSNNVKSTSHTR